MSNFPEYQHRYRASRACPSLGYGKDATITVDACLHYLNGNTRPYFSVTCEIATPASRRRNDIEAGGCMHEAVLKYWPELAPVVALHLSDDTGEPMHAEANAWYWLAGFYGGAGERYHGGNSKGNYPLPPERIDPAKTWQTTEHREPTPAECLAVFADHVRISMTEAYRLADVWRWDRRTGHLIYRTGPQIRAAMREWLGEQRERFEQDVRQAITLLDNMIAEQARRRAIKEARTV